MTKKIEAIVRADRMNAVKEGLRRIGIVGMNIVEVQGYGHHHGIAWEGHFVSPPADMVPRVQFNIVLSDHNVEKTVDAITRAARTGKEGDGIIFVYPVEDVIRIRTGERGRDALMYPDDIDVRSGKA